MSMSSKYKEFFEYSDGAAKLLIADEKLAAKTLAESVGYWVASTPNELVTKLGQGISVAYILNNKNAQSQIYSIVSQFSGSLGLIQFMDKETMKLRDVYFDKEKASLLLIGTEAEVKELQTNFPILSQVGLTEHFCSGGGYAA